MDDSDTEESTEKSELREKLAFELTSPSGRVTYPQNLTLNNFVDYMLCPTLCYELSYPRTERVRWGKVAEKVAAVFGCIFLLTVISEEFILPVMNEASKGIEAAQQPLEVALILLESISMLLFPFMVTFLLGESPPSLPPHHPVLIPHSLPRYLRVRPRCVRRDHMFWRPALLQ
jgi:sterol O-acyltransferase